MASANRSGLRLVKGPAPVPQSNKPEFTIADVSEACGLPQPVIAQFVPRTWTDQGWMYTADQVQSAIAIADDLRHGLDAT